MPYQPGKEPEELKKHLSLLLRELHTAFPKGLVVMDMWDHERWDKLAGYLVQKLGYPNGRSFLTAYGFEIFESPVESEENSAQAAKEQPESQRGKAAASPDDQQEKSGTGSQAIPEKKIEQQSDAAEEKSHSADLSGDITISEETAPQNRVSEMGRTAKKFRTLDPKKKAFMIAFYQKCLEKGYTDMTDDAQSLKVQIPVKRREESEMSGVVIPK